MNLIQKIIINFYQKERDDFPLKLKDDNNYYLITTPHEMKRDFYDLLKSKYITGIFDLMDFLPEYRLGGGLHVRPVLFILSDNKPSFFKISYCNYKFSFKNYAPNEKLPPYYLNYLETVSNFIINQTEEIPNKTILASFNILQYDKLNLENLNPIFYSKEYQTYCNSLINEKTKKLNELCQIYFAKEKEITTNDIIVSNKKILLIKDIEKQKEEINQFYTIIRPIFISAEYLLAYLNNEVIKFAIDATSETITMYHSTIENLPVILPQKSNSYYEDIYNCLLNGNEDIEHLYANYFKNSTSSNLNLNFEQLLQNDLINKLRETKHNSVYRLIQNDINELNACYTVKAYKAALIMAGSILEAFLIDWLSEIKNINFFEERNRYRVQKKDKNGNKLFDKNNEPIMKDAELIDYISEIKLLKEPDWEDAYKQATEIRIKRNNVHAKVCIKNNDVNETTCKKIIKYLEYVVKTRWELEL